MAGDADDDVTPLQVVYMTDLFRVATYIGRDPQIPSDHRIFVRSSFFTSLVVRNLLTIEEDVDLQGRPKNSNVHY